MSRWFSPVLVFKTLILQERKPRDLKTKTPMISDGDYTELLRSHWYQSRTWCPRAEKESIMSQFPSLSIWQREKVLRGQRTRKHFASSGSNKMPRERETRRTGIELWISWPTTSQGQHLSLCIKSTRTRKLSAVVKTRNSPWLSRRRTKSLSLSTRGIKN